MEGIVPSFVDSHMKRGVGRPASQVSFRHGDYSVNQTGKISALGEQFHRHAGTVGEYNMQWVGWRSAHLRKTVAVGRKASWAAGRPTVTRSQRGRAQTQVGRQMWKLVGLL